MPELPEVETTRRALRPSLVGRRVVEVRGLDYGPLVAPLGPAAFRAALTGRRIAEVGRRGKHLLLELEGREVLTIHLRMSGRLGLRPAQEPIGRHTHAVLDLDNGISLHFHDPRKFGRMRLLSPQEYAALDRRLGPEPLQPEWDALALARQLQRRPRARLKALLLDQRFLAGLGNIYADEALFRAGLRPTRPAGSLSPEEAARLHRAILAVLEDAIAAQGTTLADGAFRFGRDEAGTFADRLQVYGRTGQPCPRCGHPIARQTVAGRSSHYCPICQQ